MPLLSASLFRRLLFPDDADFVPRFGAHSVGPGFVEFFEFSGFLRHRPGEVVEFAAVLAHVVELPRGVVLGDEFVIALPHGAVAFVFPKECARRGAVGSSPQPADGGGGASPTRGANGAANAWRHRAQRSDVGSRQRARL